ncbi:M28 family peptidase [Simiduia agarivorans]|uniref:Carboxypeptidase Q n=1 Tax=Simiduia agarivorans (strain DSM 21679 / JCM 13881 / BCRC 17597 / SA1) TaxID=1117647 RepID=K4KLX4_SIMAS|nr:M28 family peptidase [Simiduia agarivorans]AFV00042.1 peptidase M28 [Simiduia agarivorans SA1 = DSM 21679]
MRSLFTGALLLALTACTTPQIQQDPLADLRDRALTDMTGYQLVSDLTTEVGARMPGTEADARAVKWMEQRFKTMGFDKVWLEPVVFPLWERKHERAAVIGNSSQPLHITALGGSAGGKLSAEVFMVDDFAALQAVDDAAVQGKIVFIRNRMDKHIDGAGYGEAVIARAKGAITAEKKGASALLIRSIGTDSHRFPHTGMMSLSAGTPTIPAAALSNPDADQLERLLVKGAVEVALDIDVGFTGEYRSHNVIAEVTGSSRPDERIVIGGHLDSWDLGTGALDDGAGVAITTAAAAFFLHPEHRPARTLRVIAFANEEQGLLGAKAYARDNEALLKNHVIASESDFGAGRIYAWETKMAREDAAMVARIKHLMAPLGIDYKGNKATGGGPDIIPMAEKGVPVFRLKQDGTDYFDYHHTADDTLDKIVVEDFNQNIAAWVVMLGVLANEWER